MNGMSVLEKMRKYCFIVKVKMDLRNFSKNSSGAGKFRVY